MWPPADGNFKQLYYISTNQIQRGTGSEGHWKMARSYFPGTLNIHFKNGRFGEFQQFSIRKEFWETSSK